MNNVSLVGRLTKEPEFKYTPNGIAVCNFTLAVNGRISTRHYENDKGDCVYVAEIVADFVQFLDPKPQGQGDDQQQHNPYAGNMNTQNQSAYQYGAGGGSIAVSDEDLPF